MITRAVWLLAPLHMSQQEGLAVEAGYGSASTTMAAQASPETHVCLVRFAIAASQY